MTKPLRAIARITDKWEPTRDRVLWVPVFMGLGVVFYFNLLAEPLLWHGVMALSLGVMLWVCVWRFFPKWAYAAFCLMLITVGFLSAQLRTYSVQAPQINELLVPVGVRGVIANLSAGDDEGGAGRRRVVLQDVVVDGLNSADTPRRIRLLSYHIPRDARPGDRVFLLARLTPLSGAQAPGGFDFRRQMFFEGVGAMGFTLGGYELLSRAPPSGLVGFFDELRAKAALRIAQLVPAPAASVTSALLVGERAGIPAIVNTHMRGAGLAHLLAISGMHLGVVCGAVFFFVRFLLALFPAFALRVPIKSVAALCAFGAGIFYMMLAGMPVPTVRAMIMTGLVLFAVMVGRTALSMRTIAFAAIVVLLIKPESLMGPSFQMSFAAVLAMIAFYEGAGRDFFVKLKEHHWLFRGGVYFAAIGASTFLAGFATLPAGLHHFGQMQMLGMMGNAVAIPLTTMVVMPSGVMALVLMPFGLEAPFIKLAGLGVSGILQVAQHVSQMPYAILRLPNVPGAYYAVSAVGFLVVCLWHGWQRFWGLPIMWGALILGVLSGRAAGLVDMEGRAFAFKDGGEIVYVLKRPTPFVRRNWVGYFGGHEYQDGKLFVDNGAHDASALGKLGVSCDDFACRVVAKGANLSVVKQGAVMNEECQWASFVIYAAPGHVPDNVCKANVMTLDDITQGGGMALFASNGVWWAEPFVKANYRRPWVRP